MDLSADMARLAAHRFAGTIEGVTVSFACGDVVALPLRNETFNCAYAMHSHLYWPSPAAGIREVHRVLRPGGRILLGMDVVSGVRLVKWFGRDYEPLPPARLSKLLGECGFVDVATQHLTRGVVSVVGVRP